MGDSARGILFIRDKAAERIATVAALSVPGCLRHSGGFEKLTRSHYPKVNIEMDGEAVAASVYIAATWPSPLALVATRVRDTVSQHLYAYLGRPVVRCDVQVAAIVATSQLSGSFRATSAHDSSSTSTEPNAAGMQHKRSRLDSLPASLQEEFGTGYGVLK